MSIDLDPAVASSYTCEITPVFDDGLYGNPEYIDIKLEDYVLSSPYSNSQIHVYPVEEFSALEMVWIEEDVSQLETHLEAWASGDGSAAVEQSWPPFYTVGYETVGRFFFAHYGVVSFSGGAGVRYVTGFAQDLAVFVDPVDYTYQALTDDGRYWISAIFPISHPVLPSEQTWPPDGMTMEEYFENEDAYIADNTDLLNAQDPESFTPSISALDDLVASIVITP